MSDRLPRHLRDAGFQRRLGELDRARPTDRDILRDLPLVAARPFVPGKVVDCPAGWKADHAADWPPINFDGRPHVVRRCRCGSTWLERIEA